MSASVVEETTEVNEAMLLQFLREQCEQSFGFFARYFFKVRKGSSFILAEHHHQVIAELEALHAGSLTTILGLSAVFVMLFLPRLPR